MDKVFQEEQKKLAEIESKIDSIASRYEVRVNNLQAEIDDYVCFDYEDVQRKQELIREREFAIRLAEQFRDYQSSPYFGRLDLDPEDMDESVVYYIGKEDISDSANTIVIDWRTPIGICYYASNQKEFRVNGTTYSLALKRALDIKNAVLVSYHTEYDGETVSLEGDVIDPFLLTVLKDKRRHNRLTDIIRTIQGNQNEIIRKPRSESFVVQGCAGSGKTMILLHRLSFLKFNNRNMTLSGVKIITPNKFFDAHINDLSIELGLTAIERYSVEEYYVSLINRYSSKMIAEVNVDSEQSLSTDLLTDLYSMQYLSDSISHYNKYWEQVLGEIDEAYLQQFFEKFRITYPNTAVHTADTVSRLEQGMRQIVSAISEFEKKEESVFSRLDGIDGEIAAVQQEYNRVFSSLDNTKKQTISRIDLEIEALTETLKKNEDHFIALRSRSDDLTRQRKQAEETSEQYASVLRAFSRGADFYSEYDSFVQLNDAGSSIIRNRCNTIITDIIDAEKTYAKTPIYNFSKRNGLRKKIAESKKQFAIEVTRIVSEQIHEAQAKQDHLFNTINVSNEKIAELSDSIRFADKELRTMRSRISALRECSQIFSSEELPDMRTALLSVSYKECASILSSYEEQRSIANRISRRLGSLKQIKLGLEKEKQELIKSGYSIEEKAYIAECTNLIKKLHFSEITRKVMFRDLLSQYHQYNQKYQKTNYRHKLYLKLLYCSLYFTRLLNPDNYLNIDEAQDISIAEYQLLRMVLGDKCVFNLYGDINQSVYSYKGITDWDEIANITSGNIYVLNENYRNTLQITEFCNKEFGTEVYPIGVSGKSIWETDTVSAVKWIQDIKKKNPDFRVAIICRNGLKSVQECLRSILIGQDISWDSVDDRKISVISVETAKGLEFEAIVAIVDQMSNNEKYVSYTRALDFLAVVRDKYSDDPDLDESAEEIDNEFIDVDAGNEVIDKHPVGHFFSWEILNEATAVKTCDKSFFEHNESGVPNEISWFFDSGSMLPGDTKTITLYFRDLSFVGKVAYNAAKPNRMRIFWNAELGELLRQYRSDEITKVEFRKLDNDSYRVSVLGNKDISLLKHHNGELHLVDNPTGGEINPDVSTKMPSFSTEEYVLLAEFDSILEDRFGMDHKLSVTQQRIIVELYKGKSIACNAPSGSMKSVMLYLLALKEHQASGKQTLLTAEAHLQENELVLADRLGLKGGIISTMDEFLADFKKEKYDIIFVSYDFFKQYKNVGPFIDYFTDKVAYWGLDHPASERSIWDQLNNCGTALNAIMFLMEKTGFSDLDLSNYQRIDIIGTVDLSMVKRHTLLSAEEKLKWLLENLDELHGQGLIYCDDEVTCKTLGKHLRKAKIMAEAYIDVTNPDKKERINYLTNSFTCGGIPVLVTTHEVGKNLSNPNIRFIIHYDIPTDQELYQLHVTQVGPLASNVVVHDLQV